MRPNISEEMQGRIKAVINVLEANRGEWMSSPIIGKKVGLDGPAVRNVMPDIKLLYPELTTNKRLGYLLPKKQADDIGANSRYRKKPSTEAKKVMTTEPAVTKKPTAFLNGSDFRRGEIWKTNASNGSSELFLVFNFVDGKIIGLPLLEKEDSTASYVISFNTKYVPNGKRYFVDCRLIKAKPEKYFKTRLDRITPEVYTEIQDMTRLMCGFKKDVERVEVPVEVIKEVEKKVEVPVEVIKEVEKKVEVPVEVIKEVEKKVEVPVEVIKEVPVDNLELALLRQKVEIYEKLLDRLLAK